MDKEVEPAVLAVINEKRLQSDKRTPVEIIARMGVSDARQKASETAWLAAGDVVIATVWAEFVSIGAGGRWFCLESLDTQRLPGGGERTAFQSQRAQERMKLLKRSLDAGSGFRAVLQTNRVAIANLETDKAAKVSVRVPDHEEWHVAAWHADRQLAVLARGPRGWLPGDEEMQAAQARGGIPAAAPAEVAPAPASAQDLQAAATEYLTRHFAGYGYKVDPVADPKAGYALEVSDKKGKTLLKLAVKGIGVGAPTFRLTAEERAGAARGDPWRLAVVSDAIGAAAQHKLYRPAEIDQAPGLDA